MRRSAPRRIAQVIAATGLVSLALGVGGALAGPTKPLSLFLVVGQSNAAGFGQPVPKVQTVDSRVWDVSSEPKLARNPLGDAPGVGFAVSAGHVFAAHGLRVGLVQCASGGLSIDSWLPGASWYDRCIAMAKAALAYGTVSGVLFHQGESNSASLALAQEWPAKFRTFVTSIRRDLARPALPVVFGLTRDFSACASCGLPFGAALRDEQRRVRIRGVALVQADDLAVNGEHFTPAAYRQLGVRYAKAMLPLIIRSRR